MKIARNIEMLEIVGPHGILYPTLTWDENEVVLMDTGMPGQLELIRSAVKNAGFALEKITKVILTHHDMDHIGCAKLLVELGAEILAHEEELPYIQGDKTPVKIAAMERRLQDLSENERMFFERMRAGAPNFYVHVDRVVRDGDFLPWCGGIRIIHTPGHMPGHISLLLQKENIIVAGDAANVSEGIVTGPNPQHSLDMETAEESYEKLKKYDSAAMICYHGGLSGNVCG